MLNVRRILCVNKHPVGEIHRQISSVGGLDADGARWKMSQEAAVEQLESGRLRFYIQHPPLDPIWVMLARSLAGEKYLTTEIDGDEPYTLLGLPDCP
jgi:hypothetical protein